MSYQIISGNQIVAIGATRGECVAALAYAPSPTHVTITSGGGSTQKVTIFHNTWVNKQCTLERTYSDEYTRLEILNDIALDVCAMHGYRLQQAQEIQQ